MSSPNETGTAVAKSEGTAIGGLATFRDALAQNVFTSLDIATDQGKAQLLMAMQGENDALGDLVGEVVEVSHLVVHNVEVLDEQTGELLERDRIVIITPDGSMLAAVSQGIRKSVQLLTALYGLPPYTPALRVKVVQVNTRKGRRLYQLVPAVEVQTSDASKTTNARKR